MVSRRHATTTYLGDTELTPQGRTIVHPHPDVRLVDGIASFLHRDHLASVTVITDDAGATITTRDYTPHGDMEGHEWVDPLSQPESKAWIGERFDPETGLVYLHARYYDPKLGLFTQGDWWDPTEPGVGTNRYMYSAGDPVNLSDRNGHFAQIGLGIGLGVAFGVAVEVFDQFSETGTISDVGAIGRAAVAGAVAGGVAAATGNLAAGRVAGTVAKGIVGGLVGGAVGGATSSAVSDMLEGKAPSAADMGEAAAFGAGAGALTGGVFGGIEAAAPVAAVAPRAATALSRVGKAAAKKGFGTATKEAAKDIAGVQEGETDADGHAETSANGESEDGNESGRPGM